MKTIAISLAGHTNLGKTSLTRTLLRREVGIVDDRPHVTDLADGHTFEQDDLATIILWDLPGFGDSLKLKERVKSSGLMAWLLKTYDRLLDRPLWCSQKSLENAKNHADIILYMVDATANPSHSPEVQVELELLNEIGKPIILLLNQTGIPEQKRDAVLTQNWLNASQAHPQVRDAMALDGWMRCWRQEALLFDHIAALLNPEKKPDFHRLIQKWCQRNHLQVFQKSMTQIAQYLAESSADSVEMEKESLFEQGRSLLTKVESPELSKAKKLLSERLTARSQASMTALFRLHHIEGESKQQIEQNLNCLAKGNEISAPPALWAILGGITSGAATGVIADVAAGGLTLGGGAIVGGLLGGLAAYALGFGYQKIKGENNKPCVVWDQKILLEEWKAWALRYLMVAHYGFGQGSFNAIPEQWPSEWLSSIENWINIHSIRIEKSLKSKNQADIETEFTRMIETILNDFYTANHTEQ